MTAETKQNTINQTMNVRKCVMDSTFNLKIQDKLERKIRYLCEKFPNTEWSGIMFYKEESGNIEDKNLVLTAEDFYLLDVGTTAYTEYEVTPDVLNYQIENELLDCWWCIIHSHNTMATFFSGTDMNTLSKAGQTMNHFLSLIVNNKGEYNARLTRIADESIKCFVDAKYNSFNDEQKEFKYDFKATRKNLEWIPANIEICDCQEITDEEKSFLDERIEEIDKQKKEKEKEKTYANTRWNWDETDFYSGWDRKYNEYNYEYKKDSDDCKIEKRFMYSIITGDLFPMKNVLSSSMDDIIGRAIKIYNVKKKAMSEMIENEGGIEVYVDNMIAITGLYISQEEDVINDIMDCMERHSSNEWVNDLYQTLRSMEYTYEYE